MFMRLWENSHFLCIKHSQTPTKHSMFFRLSGVLIEIMKMLAVPVRRMAAMNVMKPMTDDQFHHTLITVMIRVGWALCLWLCVNSFVVCVVISLWEEALDICRSEELVFGGKESGGRG